MGGELGQSRAGEIDGVDIGQCSTRSGEYIVLGKKPLKCLSSWRAKRRGHLELAESDSGGWRAARAMTPLLEWLRVSYLVRLHAGGETIRGKTMYVAFSKVVALVLLLAFTGCAGPTPDIHKGYVGENQPVAEIAIVRAVTAGIHTMDGEELKHPEKDKYYKEVYLPPGQHTITLYRWFAVSVLIVSKGYIEVVSKPFSVNLEAGHIYELHGDRTTGVIRVILWIEDAATGEIIAREADPKVL